MTLHYSALFGRTATFIIGFHSIRGLFLVLAHSNNNKTAVSFNLLSRGRTAESKLSVHTVRADDLLYHCGVFGALGASSSLKRRRRRLISVRTQRMATSYCFSVQTIRCIYLELGSYSWLFLWISTHLIGEEKRDTLQIF